METPNENAKSESDLREIFANPKDKDVDAYLAEEDLDSFARYLTSRFAYDDEPIVVLAGLLKRISNAVGVNSDTMRTDVTDRVDYLMERLYSWSYTSQRDANDFINTLDKKAEEILGLDGPSN